jgi:hypothetical protein
LRGEDVPDQQRERGGEAPFAGQRLADLLGRFLAALDRIDRAERGHGDLARGHAGNERDVDLPVEADRRRAAQPFADDGGKGCSRWRAFPPLGRANDARNQISTIIEKIVVPARFKNIMARV